MKNQPVEQKTKIFIKRANKIHNDKYTYEKVQYINSYTKVTITCTQHGDFDQDPHSHLKGHGCNECGKISRGETNKSTKEDFLKKAKEKYGDKYNYSDINYVDHYTLIELVCEIHGTFKVTPLSHIKGIHCKICKHEKSDIRTLEDFKNIANKVHKNEFNYNKTTFYGIDQPLNITCSKHGDFIINPILHLKGKGCHKCDKDLSDTDKFIKKSKKKNGNKFDYSQVEYLNYNLPVKIICPNHNEFEMTPADHLRFKYGCIKCNGKITNRDDFIEKSKKIHNDIYDYSKVIYTFSNKHVTIICKIHGEFNIIPASHIRGTGCTKCGKQRAANSLKTTLQEFIDRSNIIHDHKYDYSKAIYNNNHTNITIICPKHGEFEQLPANHLAGKGCLDCMKNNYSKKQIKWLNTIAKEQNIFIQHALNGGEYRIPGTRKSADGYCKETNTIYEFNGDLYHGNPKKYNMADYNPMNGRSFYSLYLKTLEKEVILFNMGYNVVTIWEDDYNQSLKKAFLI